MFDADSFLQATVEGVLDTSRKPIPEIEEATLQIKELKLKISGEYTILDVIMIVDEEEARTATGLPEPQIRHGIFLDIDDSGMLDMTEGKNIDLGKLRQALGQNDEGEWSPAMMEGAVCTGHVVQDPDKDDPTKIYNRIKAFALNG